jgi:outer membrane protein OmpA-like peptidoglycan-associated protein
MRIFISNRLFLSITMILFLSHLLHAQKIESLVSPFQGSNTLGNHQARFAPLTLLVEPLDNKKNPSTLEVEGSLTSTIYKSPKEVSAFEVYSSYKKVLKKADFDLLLDCESGKCNAKMKVKSVYGYPNKELEKRTYKGVSVNDKGYLVGWAEYYLSAKKKIADKTYYVMIIISNQRNLYSVDLLQVTDMEEETVKLAPKLLKDKIKSEGKAVLHGLYFETGKDIITSLSQPSLNAIASYLKANTNLSFYVVGHTDDTGDLNNNISLSKKRAIAVIAALKNLGVKTSKLSGNGVGPFSPATTNHTDAGKAKNRRVELVLRLK